MTDTVIKVENLSKLYRLGEVGTGTLSHDLNRWWARIRGKEDPFAKIGHINDRTQKAEKGEYVWALKDINFEVKRGEVLGIIGKNGAGKSTLLKILSRITAPTTGEINIKGRVGSLLEVGTGFHPEMTGRENIYMNGTILGMTKKEITTKLDDIVDFAGVAKYLDTPVKRYSSGMMVRLGFAVAAFLEPEILIVDEVLAVGDAEFQKRAIGKMQEISEGGGRTVLFVSHNMASIQNLCPLSILIDTGKIIEYSNSSKVVSYYLNSGSNVFHKEFEYYERPGDNIVKINSYAIIDEHLMPTSQISTTKKVGVTIKYEILKNGYLPLPNFHLYYETGEKVFVSIIPEMKASCEVGIHQKTMWIPRDFLNEGNYYVEIAVSTMLPKIIHYRKSNVLSFTSFEDRANRSNNNRVKLKGVIKPLLKWS